LFGGLLEEGGKYSFSGNRGGVKRRLEKRGYCPRVQSDKGRRPSERPNKEGGGGESKKQKAREVVRVKLCAGKDLCRSNDQKGKERRWVFDEKKKTAKGDAAFYQGDPNSQPNPGTLKEKGRSKKTMWGPR